MSALTSTLTKHKIKFILLALAGLFTYFYLFSESPEELSPTTVVVERVERGEVTSGIETTGEIIAAQKLNLDVYKQTTRIEQVNVLNGGQVAAGDTLFSFDTSNAFVEVESSRVDVAQAQLTLENEQENYTDPNTQVRTLENDILQLESAIAQAEIDKRKASRDYLNADLSAESADERTEDKIGPQVSGLYQSDTRGEYKIEIYSSNADSGYSYRVTGLETDITEVVFNLPTKLGASGLEVTFPQNAQARDSWIIAVPNTYAANYIKNREDYEETMTDLDLLIAAQRLSIANKNEEIANLLQTDSTQFRDLDVARAQAALAKAREQLSQNFEVVQEQSIIAPFSGTVEGMENVVVGASPTRDTNDPISLGVLISDDFLATFSLNAVDVAKVEIGQLVQVGVTSFPEAPSLDAFITEISSLPNNDGVAQYEVQALIEIPEDVTIELREGLLADIEIVEEVAKNVLRIPSAAVEYSNRQAQVRVVDELTPEQKLMIDELGIVRLAAGEQIGYLKDVELGVVGAFYSEVTRGLIQDQYLVIGSVEPETTLQETGPSGRPRGEREAD